MAEFINPFSGVVPGRKLTLRELTRAIRMALSAEEEAVHFYEALADATENALAREVLQDIANEERVHAGEFQRLINILAPDEEGFLQDGAAEVNDMAAKFSGGAAPAEAPKAVPTVGSMKSNS